MGTQWRTAKVRRPRSVVEGYVQVLIEEMSDDNPGLELHVTGSWRRGADPVGDLDVVVFNHGTFTPSLFETGVVLPSLPTLTYQRQGPRLAAAEFELQDGPLHVDFFQFTTASRGPALLALTGPAPLNVFMRRQAKRSGLALSQEALKVRSTGERLNVPTEAAVFAALGMRYETPEQRQRWAAVGL
jgi:DNA polymerase/3'-5' exonuclease PolX